MAAAEEPPEAAPKKKSKLPLLIGLVLALALGAGGFFATYTGLVFGSAPDAQETRSEVVALPDIAFVPIPPVVISLGATAQNSHLRMIAQLEVAKSHADEVTLLMPRIQDVLNGYLRAVEVAQLEDPTALVRLRAQMLRRLQIVTGEGRVRDLLITEFVLN
ncbi:MAG: flagellar basal body-associated FliL family protein [Pseudorhodobacter sp.]|nr:flagellar basal body-associated FliL family protein [Pseudorhodobacter sp.]